MISSASVLLVDYLVDERSMYAAALRAAGYRVVECDAPGAALEQAIADPPGAVVTRIMQPGSPMDGIDLTYRLKREVPAHVPVVVITSRIEPELRVAATAAGCEAFLTIPCLPDDLVATVRRLLP
jgi:CheY-like chemotaxis protein